MKMTYGPWTRRVDSEEEGITITTSERLTVDAAYLRFTEAMTMRGDAAMRDILDHAIFGTLGDLTPSSGGSDA